MRKALKVLLTPFWTLLKIVAFSFAIGIIFMAEAIAAKPQRGFFLVLVVTALVLSLDNLFRTWEEEREAKRFENCTEALNMCHMLGGEQLSKKAQQHADGRLGESARRVKWNHDNLVILQKGGLEALERRGVTVPQYNYDDADALEHARKSAWLSLTQEIAQSEESFYRLYDRFLGVLEHYTQFRLRSRDWKAYLDEEMVEKSA